MTRARTPAAAHGLALAALLVAVIARGWVRLGQVEAELRAADDELAHRD